jgi:hypothetical protein
MLALGVFIHIGKWCKSWGRQSKIDSPICLPHSPPTPPLYTGICAHLLILSYRQEGVIIQAIQSTDLVRHSGVALAAVSDRKGKTASKHLRNAPNSNRSTGTYIWTERMKCFNV